MDLAGNGMHFHTAPAVADVCAQGMLALLFNHDGNVGSDLAGNSLRRKSEI